MATKLAALDEPDFGVLPAVKKVRSCTLDQPTQKLLELIFNMDMFNHAMKDLEIGGCGLNGVGRVWFDRIIHPLCM